ncbi:glycosyltransferase [Lacticaseibacillus jixianensis]|uniref:Glycosyltransferase n=1 Tax=Lacticaseibacillus jixianensis TaxID=2486012 RepID=A0ABW4B9K2_9LACO|nr:glycosyltransferase [Lacticaseibacillus jixianensis]
MFYFVGNVFSSEITGIESAQLKRLKLFQLFHEPAKVVSTGSAMARTVNARKYGLTKETYINEYDFLCEVPFDFRQQVTLASLGLAGHHRVSHHDPHFTRYADGDQLVAQVATTADGQVTSVRYFDAHNRSRVEDQYDPRGFLAVRYYYDESLNVVSKVFFNPQGKARLRFLYTDQPTPRVGAIQVLRPDGRVIILSNIDALQSYFFDRLNESTPHNVFIVDRTQRNAWAIENMKTKAFRLFHLHNVHASGLAANAASRDLNYNYRQPLNNLDRWEGAIVLTDQQMADIRLTFPAAKFIKVPAVVIPPARLAAPRVPVAARTPGKIIAVARIDRQKQLKELVQVVKLIHDQQADTTLDIWGLTQEQKYKDEILALIAQLHLEEVVKLKGFSKELNGIYDHARLMILTSRIEGTILALAEAQSHGVPVVSYDFKYGPREFILPGRNGEIVPVGARQAAAAQALKLLGDDETWQRYSTGCYDASARYSADHVFASWRAVKARAEAFYCQQ